MTVNRVGPNQNQTPTPAAAPETAAPAAAPAAPAAAPAANTASAFQPTPRPAANAALGNVASPHVPLPSINAGNAPGPVDVASREGKAAIDKSVEYITNAPKNGNSGFVPGAAVNASNLGAKSVTRDELGMTHVRLDRMQDGLKVYGEQVISHLGVDGNVKDVTGDLGKMDFAAGAQNAPKLSDKQAIKAATDLFKKEEGVSPEKAPSAELMYYQAEDGKYHKAYRVEVRNTTDGDRPMNMNYMIDAQTGKSLTKFNTIDGVDLRDAHAAAPVTVTGTATPNAKIEDNKTITSTIHIDKDLDLSKVTADLDLNHTYRGDLTVTLTSPSGKTATLSAKEGGSADDIKKSFDLTSLFPGEKTVGDWKLTVTDSATRDTGTLNNWKLNLTGAEKTPPTGEGEAVNVKKTATPNAKIEDNKAVTSTITIDDDISIDAIKISADADHTYRGDLTATLTSPSGKTVTLLNREGGSADNWQIADKDLADFKGESAKGNWTLTVKDNAAQDTGTLKSWSLDVTGKKPGTPGPGPGPGPTPGAKDDTTIYSGKVEIGATQNPDGTWKLSDSTRGKGVETRDANNKSSPTGSTEFKDTNNIWGEATDDARSKAAVDAQYGAQMTYDFYKNILGRDSIDGAGEKLLNNVHINKNYVNAYWDGTQMNYGDGNGTDAGPLTGIDIAGHEITHGMTERTSGLVYSGESGGLNEAMSDIMGKGVEWYAAQQNPAVKFTWGVGESVWTPGKAGDALRYMNDPTKDNYSVDNYKNYPKQTEVHGSSGIANNAFFLMVEGGTNKTSGMNVPQGIGMEKALKIMYRASTTYFTPKTTFAQAAQAAVKAATDLYGANSPEVKATTEAWKAVGTIP